MAQVVHEKKNDLVFRRIGRSKSKTLLPEEFGATTKAQNWKTNFNLKRKQHQCVQFDFCRISTGKKTTLHTKIPQPPKKSLVFLWVFFVEADSKNPTKPPQQQLQFRSHQPPKRSLDGFHNIIVLGRLRQTAGQVHHGDVRRGDAEGHTGGTTEKVTTGGVVDGTWGEINKW